MMKVQAVLLGFIALLTLLTTSVGAKGQGDSVASAKNQLWLSPVKTGDSVVSRIYAKRTVFVDELDKRFCAEHNPDEAKRKKCIENSRYYKTEFAFFTDMRGDGEYSIGLNGKEFKLRRISKRPGKPHDYIGSFAGEGVSVVISHPRLMGKIKYEEGEVVDANYKVLVTVKKGTLKKSFKGVLWDGR
jgi:hypothetical protein